MGARTRVFGLTPSRLIIASILGPTNPRVTETAATEYIGSGLYFSESTSGASQVSGLEDLRPLLRTVVQSENHDPVTIDGVGCYKRGVRNDQLTSTGNPT